MKRYQKEWIHVSCVFLNEKIRFRDMHRIRDPDGLGRALAENEGGFCKVCKSEEGAMIECQKKCGIWMHPLCGFLEGFKVSTRVRVDGEVGIEIECGGPHQKQGMEEEEAELRDASYFKKVRAMRYEGPL